jgi:hypothetical protein
MMPNRLSRTQDATLLKDLRPILVAKKVNARAAFGFRARSPGSICSLVVLLIAAALFSACVSNTPLVVTEFQQCPNESIKGGVKKHRTLVAEGFIFYQPEKAGEMVTERNTKTGALRTREQGAQPEYYSVYTKSGQDTGVGFLAVSISAEIQDALKKNSSTVYNSPAPTRMRIIASTYDCSLKTQNIIKIEEADTGKVLYENKSASRDE